LDACHCLQHFEERQINAQHCLLNRLEAGGKQAVIFAIRAAFAYRKQWHTFYWLTTCERGLLAAPVLGSLIEVPVSGGADASPSAGTIVA